MKDEQTGPTDHREIDDVYELLVDRRQRTLLSVIAEYSEATRSTSLGELASDVERRERERDTLDGPSSAKLLQRLHHVHLPMLDDAGVVGYDPDSKRVVIPDRNAAACRSRRYRLGN